MKVELHPIEFEIVSQDLDEVLARVRCFDEVACKVEINTMVTLNIWNEIAEQVAKALKQIEEAR